MISIFYILLKIKYNIMSVLSGLEFKNRYPNYQAVKIIGNNFNNYIYRIGLNIDPIPFRPYGKCQAGGLSFTDMRFLPYFMSCGSHIAYVDIVDDSRIYLDNYKSYKADMIVLTKIIPIQDYLSQLSEEQFFKLKPFAVHIIRHIPNPTKEWQLAAVNRRGDAIMYINNPDDEVRAASDKEIYFNFYMASKLLLEPWETATVESYQKKWNSYLNSRMMNY